MSAAGYDTLGFSDTLGVYLMGKLATLSKTFRAQPSLMDRTQGTRTWNRVFGRRAETDINKFPRTRPRVGGSFASGITSEGAAFKRLLQAMRSMAPGGWSDDRWEATMRHYVGAVYVASNRICRQYSQAEFQVYQRDPYHQDGRRPVSKDHDLVKTLEHPNPQDTFGKLMWRWGQQLHLTGTALTWMVPNKLGTPYELYCIPTCIAIPQPAINPDFPDGFYRIQPVYPYGPFSSYPTPVSAVGAPIPAEWMMRFQYPHPLLRYEGYAPLTALNMEIDEFQSIGRSRWYKMKRGVKPSAVLNMDNVEGAQQWPEEEIERIKAIYEAALQGPENWGNLFVAGPGMRLEEWGMSPQEMDFPQSWEQMLGFIMGAGFGISKPAAGMVDTSSYSTLWAAIKQLQVVTVQPDLDDIAKDLTRHLCPFFGDDLFIEIKCKRIDDHDLMISKINTGITAKCLTKNQVLRLLDLPTTKEQWGDEIAGTEPQPAGGMEQMLGGQGQQQAGGPQAPQPLLGGTQEAPSNIGQELMNITNQFPDEKETERNREPTFNPGSMGPRKNLIKAIQRLERNGYHLNGKV